MPAEAPKSNFVLRLIAIYKLATAALFFAGAIGVLHFLNRDVADWLVHLMGMIRFDPHNRYAEFLLKEAGLVTNRTIEMMSAVGFFYATLFTIEGVGLYLRKRWAEYLVVILTGSLLPLEIYELCRSVNIIKVAILLGNLAILSYLVYVLLTTSKKHEEK